MEGDPQGRGVLRRGRRGQATIEFAFSAPLLLLCLFGAVDAAAWSLESSAAVAAVEEGTRLAASAAGTPLGQRPPDAIQVTGGVIAQLRPAMFGTRVIPWPSAGCPVSPENVEAVLGARVVAVCVQEHVPPPCTPSSQPPSPYCGDPPTVTVRAVGFIASLVPPGFGLGWHAGEIPVSLGATTHVLRFAP